jgi:hypothetical protein
MKKITHVYPMLSLTCADFAIKTTICDLHINIKLELSIFANITKLIIIVLFGYFIIFV